MHIKPFTICKSLVLFFIRFLYFFNVNNGFVVVTHPSNFEMPNTIEVFTAKNDFANCSGVIIKSSFRK